MRLIGVSVTLGSTPSSAFRLSIRGVWIEPGVTAFTRMFRSPTSFAALFTKPTTYQLDGSALCWPLGLPRTPCLLAEYAACFGNPCVPWIWRVPGQHSAQLLSSNSQNLPSSHRLCFPDQACSAAALSCSTSSLPAKSLWSAPPHDKSQLHQKTCQIYTHN